ncbi:helix-turn-helix domain-containing protein [Sphingobium sp.]|uniref:TetR/AcrR family transcriptional regulator n=1 Tax=Sphingobium sp. TaxID=1912891 RepID=UPI0028BF235C|nr:helix-turn-helix domain-containing protein [Sphingobium sp.]
MAQIEGETKVRILTAALEVFAETGFSGASTREIARRANVHQPALAYHFRAKEDLWKAAIDHVFEGFQAILDGPCDRQASREDRIRAFITMLFQYVAQHPAWFAFIIHEGRTVEERSKYMVERWLLPQARAMLRILAGLDWPRDEAGIRFAQSVLAIVTGATSIFAQRESILQLSRLDVRSPSFVQYHADVVTRLITAEILNLADSQH